MLPRSAPGICPRFPLRAPGSAAGSHDEHRLSLAEPAHRLLAEVAVHLLQIVPDRCPSCAASELCPGKHQTRSSGGGRSCAVGRTGWGRPNLLDCFQPCTPPGQPLQAFRQEALSEFQTEIAQTHHPCHSRIGYRGSFRDLAATHIKQTIAFLANRSISTL